jgi:hypothetical protein
MQLRWDAVTIDCRDPQTLADPEGNLFCLVAD